MKLLLHGSNISTFISLRVMAEVKKGEYEPLINVEEFGRFE